MAQRALTVVFALTIAVTTLAATTVVALSPRPALAAAHAPAPAADEHHDREDAAPLVFALIGDTPYGDVERMQCPALVDHINADPDVEMVLHAGDVKDGRSTCSDQRFADLTALFDTFEDPFVLTPGQRVDGLPPAARRVLSAHRASRGRAPRLLRAPGADRWRAPYAGPDRGP